MSVIRYLESENGDEFHCGDDHELALTYRLVQMVELGSSTCKYRQSKLGGKMAMKHVAEELGFPAFLVQLRHQAIHEHTLIPS